MAEIADVVNLPLPPVVIGLHGLGQMQRVVQHLGNRY